MGDVLRLFIVTFVALVVLSACGSDEQQAQAGVVPQGTPSQETHSYNFSDSAAGCSTGRQTFLTREAYCNGLKDDALNNNCAKTARQNAFKIRGCAGVF